MNYKLSVNEGISLTEAIGLLRRAGRKTADARQLIRIVPEANIVVTARDSSNTLVGLARGIKEISGCCYISDLVVDSTQGDNIGESLIRRMRSHLGPNAIILLEKAPAAMAYSAEIE